MIEHSPNLQKKYMGKLQEAGNELEEELAARKHGTSDSLPSNSSGYDLGVYVEDQAKTAKRLKQFWER